MISNEFWKNKKVFITGNTGFKGTWMTCLLNLLGSKVVGYSLPPEESRSMFDIVAMENKCETYYSDIRDYDMLLRRITESRPDVVFHLAAQPLVHESYRKPLETYEVNVMGTANVLEAVRHVDTVRAVVAITTDKVYENTETGTEFIETDRLGGFDPYSNSKACCEMVINSYRDSFFNSSQFKTFIGSARAGNVVGGGDFAKNRLIPDCVRTMEKGGKIVIRAPKAIRPWQHVIEPLTAYLMLAEKLWTDGINYSSGWNIGPNAESCISVLEVLQMFCRCWGVNNGYIVEENPFHEAGVLRLSIEKAAEQLKWTPVWDIEHTIAGVVEWHKAHIGNEDMYDFTLNQIREYLTCQKEKYKCH